MNKIQHFENFRQEDNIKLRHKSKEKEGRKESFSVV
jgi:hypothetical protein